MLCSKCGAEIADNSKFCTKCGNKVEKPAEPVKEESVVKKESVATEENSPKLCSVCGQELLPGAKFCTKCGQKQEVETTGQAGKISQSAGQSVGQAGKAPQSVGQAAKPAATAAPAKEKSSNTGMIVMLVIILILVLAVGGVGAYMVVGMGINPIEAISGGFSSDKESDDKDESADVQDVSGSDESSEAGEKGDATLLEAGDELAKKAEDEFNAGNYLDGAISGCAAAIEEYIGVAEENNLHEEAQEKISAVYDIYLKALAGYSETIMEQGANAAGYEQINNILTDAMELTDKLTEKAYSVDNSELTAYKESVVKTYKDMYIKSINSITEYENWSRDEAWNYADAAYSIKENGKSVLFDDSDLEDPLRMRYVYSLAWITTKRCEKGLADGSMTNADVVNNMDAILEETDYNPLLLYYIINYGSEAGINVDNYRNAYQAIIDRIKSEQGLTVGSEISVSSATTVDIRHFWYFNDLDGEDQYIVDTHNGTTKATREWIRENVPGILENE